MTCSRMIDNISIKVTNEFGLTKTNNLNESSWISIEIGTSGGGRKNTESEFKANITQITVEAYVNIAFNLFQAECILSNCVCKQA